MAKKTERRIDLVEKEVEEIRTKLQRLPGLERLIEQLTQNMATMMLAVEETRKSVAAVSSLKGGLNNNSEGVGSITEGPIPIDDHRRI